MGLSLKKNTNIKVQILTSFTDSLFGVYLHWNGVWKQWACIKSCLEKYLLSVTAAKPAISKMAEPSGERAAEGLLGLWGTEDPSWASMPVPVILHSWERFPGSWGQRHTDTERRHRQRQASGKDVKSFPGGLSSEVETTLKDIFHIIYMLNSNFHCCQSWAALRMKYAELLNQTLQIIYILRMYFFSYT